jgi:hypothetical protein
VKTLTEQADALRKGIRIIQSDRAKYRHLAGITQSPVWSHYKQWLNEHRDTLRDKWESLEEVDPFIIGMIRGKLELLKELVSLEDMLNDKVSMLAQSEERLKAEAERRESFQTRQHTGAGL